MTQPIYGVDKHTLKPVRPKNRLARSRGDKSLRAWARECAKNVQSPLKEAARAWCTTKGVRFT